jgi:hypothetical protein
MAMMTVRGRAVLGSAMVARNASARKHPGRNPGHQIGGIKTDGWNVAAAALRLSRLNRPKRSDGMTARCCLQLGAAGGSWTSHIMQFRSVGIEGSEEELTPEGDQGGEGARASIAASCRGREGGRGNGRHDESCLFPAASVTRSAFSGADRQLWSYLLKDSFNCRDPAHMVSTP